MFETIRAHQKVLLGGLLALIVPAFLLFGLSGYQSMFSDDRALARIGREVISPATFQSAQQQQLEALRGMVGEGFDASFFDTPQARTDLLEALISQRTLTHQAALRHLQVSDERIRQTIMGLPGLRRDDGSFDEPRYRGLLTAQGLTPARFEAQVRGDLAAQLPGELVQNTAWLPTKVRDRLIAAQEEQRVVRVQRFEAARYVAQVRPTQAELEAFFKDHAADYERPESARVDYVVLSRESLAKQVAVSQDELQAYYQEHAVRFEQAEERRARHILIKAGPEAKARAQALRAQLDQHPESFAKLAQTQSDDPGSAAQGGDLGFFGREMMVKPFADAVFAMAEGEIRGPIETDFGQHIVRLEAIKPAQRRPFESVRAEIEQSVRTQKAAQQYAEAAETFTNRVYEEADSLEPVAQQWQLPVQRVDGVTRAPQGAAALPPAIAHPRVLAALFAAESLEKKRNTEAIEVSPGQLVAARIVEYQPAQQRGLAEVQDQVRQRLAQEGARRLAQQAGEAVWAALKAGDAKAVAGLPAAQTVSRAQPGALSGTELQALYKIPAPGASTPTYVGLEQGERGYTVLALEAVKAAAPEVIAAKRAAQGESLARMFAQQLGRDYLEALKDRFKVERYPERIAKR